MAKTVKDTYSEILKLRNEFYQKWQDAPQYDENRDAYRAKYEAFNKALELLTPSIVDPQPEDSGELTLSVTKISDQEEPISEDLLDEIHNRWEDAPHTKWPKCPYKDFKNIACHFANWQRERDAKYKADNNICCMNFDDIEAARIGAYEQGKSDMKQQMMKEAIFCPVTKRDVGISLSITNRDIIKDTKDLSYLKVIIIKED